MNQTAGCPSCDARFFVSAAQLRAAHGWVRCGRCQQSFDAAAQVSRSLRLPSPSASAPLLQRSSNDSLGRSTADAGDALRHESLVQRAAHDRRSAVRPALQAPAGPQPASASLSEEETPAFLREPSSLILSRTDGSSAGRSVGWLFGIVLAGLLLVQVLLQQRDWLAVRAPAAAPLLARACALLDCVIAAPREIDALMISNSSLTRTGTGGYRLSLAVKNRSDLRLAMPGIELSLLDSAERTVLRRVLLARDVGAADALEPYGEWIGAVQFDLPEQTDQITDYRVLAFYP